MKTERDEGHGQNKDVTNIVNRRAKVVPKNEELSFAELVALAFNNNPPTGPNIVITVTYSKGEDGKQGTLLEGQSVKIKDGMVFYVTATDKS